MCKSFQQIALFTESKLRASSMKRFMQNCVNELNLKVEVAFSLDEYVNNKQKKPAGVVLDLQNLSVAAPKAINLARSIVPDGFVVGCHFYKSKILVQPLFDAGMDGYLHVESSPKEVLKVFKSVLSGQTYYPESLLTQYKNKLFD